MALPTTGPDLALWVVDVVLQGTASALEWDDGSPPVANVVDEVELILGHAVEADDDARLLLALTRREAWRAAVSGTVDRFRVSSDGQTVDLQQVHEHAVKMLDRAEADYDAAIATADGGSPNSAVITQITYGDDPYGTAVAVEWE